MMVGLMCKNLGQLYDQLIREAKVMCKKEGITCIALDKFTGMKSPMTGIPEPTPEGAKDLAKIIRKFVLTQIRNEEAKT